MLPTMIRTTRPVLKWCLRCYDGFALACHASPAPTRRKAAISLDSVIDRWRRAVLLLADVFTSRRRIAFVVDLEHREVSHEPRRSCAVPVVLARLEEHAVAGPDDLHGTAAPLRETHALGDVNRLAVRVRVPRRSRARREVDAA